MPRKKRRHPWGKRASMRAIRREVVETDLLDSKNRSVGTTGYKAFWCALGSGAASEGASGAPWQIPRQGAPARRSAGTQGNPHNPHTLKKAARGAGAQPKPNNPNT